MKKFTLIEILVVIAIIGILASLLLPVLGKARKQSQGAVCISQLKQQYTALYLFSDDNDGLVNSSYYLDTTDQRGGWSGWKYNIAEYLNIDLQTSNPWNDVVLGTGVFACPLDEIRTEVRHEGGYGLNIYAGAASGWITGAGNRGTPLYLSDLTDPVETNWVGDTTSINDAWHEPIYVPDDWTANEVVDNRHLGKNNVLWMDGHTSSQSYTQFASGANSDVRYYFYPVK